MERDRFARIAKNSLVALGIAGCVSQSAAPYESIKPEPSKSSELSQNSPSTAIATEAELKEYPVGSQLRQKCTLPVTDAKGKIELTRGISVKQLQSNGTWYNDGTCYITQSRKD